VGFLPQEPELDDLKKARQSVGERGREAVDVFREYNNINEKLAEPMTYDEINDLIKRHGERKTENAAAGAWMDTNVAKWTPSTGKGAHYFL
jgi:sulfate-transporting ATPase